MWPRTFSDCTRRLDNPRVALVIVVGLTLSLAVLSGPARLRAANTVVAAWSAVSPGLSGLGGAGTFPDTTGASVGFTSIPTARALLKAPRWMAAAKPATPIELQVAPKDRLTLAIVGLPVDVEHDMLRNSNVASYCIAPERPDQGTLSLCKDARLLYGRFAFSGKYNLCDFDDDCWHSTAVAIVAAGSRMRQNVFALPGQQARAEFRDNTFMNIARADYKTFVESQGDEKTQFKDFIAERFSGFGNILNVKMPIAQITYGGTGNRSYITRQMIVDHGIHAGGSLLAINVFSRFESAVECDAHSKTPPCVLTTTAAQEAALRHILANATGAGPEPSPGNDSPLLGAIVIVAGGELTDRRCDDTATAKLIGELRRHGVLTFVPVGNDGDPTKIRFPACASGAVSVGSLTRDGSIADFSNGSKTGMVALYVDGETVVLPIRGPRLPSSHDRAMVGLDPESCEEQQGANDLCKPRAPRDQYDAYLAGGTLLSAAVASGVFLNLRERHPTLTAEAVLAAFKAHPSSARPPFFEVDEQAAEQTLAGHAGQN